MALFSQPRPCTSSPLRRARADRVIWRDSDRGKVQLSGYPLDMTSLLDSTALFADSRVKDASAAPANGYVISENPATGQPIAAVRLQSRAEYDEAVRKAEAAQTHWRKLP